MDYHSTCWKIEFRCTNENVTFMVVVNFDAHLCVFQEFSLMMFHQGYQDQDPTHTQWESSKIES